MVKTEVQVTAKPHYGGLIVYEAGCIVGEPGSYRTTLEASVLAREGLSLSAELAEVDTAYILTITDPDGKRWATSVQAKPTAVEHGSDKPSDEDVSALVEVIRGIEDHEVIALAILRAGYRPPEYVDADSHETWGDDV
jgi:hypothetical protein